MRVVPLARRIRLLAFVEKLSPASLRQALRVAGILPDRPAQTGLFPANRPSGKSLQLFIGCVASFADQPVIEAAIQLLTRLGYAVEIPRHQPCCGALHRHNGFPDEADQLGDTNRRLTSNSPAQALLTLSTACHLELVEHNASQLPVISITDFLLNLLTGTPSIADFAPLESKVAVHTPCSARGNQTKSLLSLIPELGVFDLPDNETCCGSAGSYFIAQPALSEKFGSDKLIQLNSTRPDILVTTNTGCAIQFRLQLKQSGLHRIEVLHPIELLNRQLNSMGFQA